MLVIFRAPSTGVARHRKIVHNPKEILKVCVAEEYKQKNNDTLVPTKSVRWCDLRFESFQAI